MRVAVVILNWNGRAMLERFLPSVTAYTHAPDAVIVADNGSTDDSLTFLQQHYPNVGVVTLDRNYGFAEGYNKALAQVDAEYYVLLNDDVEVTPQWIDPIVELMEQDPTIAVVQPKLLMYNQRDTLEYAGGAGGFIDKYGYPFCRGRIFATVERDEHQYDDACDIFWASGAAMFVRSKVWKSLEGLDGDFFAHMEEIDFCWRAKNNGYRICYCPDATVYHVGGGTLPKSSPTKTFLNFRNNLAMLYKNLPDDQQRRVLCYRKVLNWIAAAKFVLEGHFDEARAVHRAHREYRAWIPELQHKRSRLHPHPVSCIYPHNLVLQYYLGGKKKFSQLNFNNQKQEIRK